MVRDWFVHCVRRWDEGRASEKVSAASVRMPLSAKSSLLSLVSGEVSGDAEGPLRVRRERALEAG
jgi:hypothetical protein